MKNLKNDIKTGQFHRVYLLYGSESFLRIRYRDMLTSAILPEDSGMNFSVMKADAVSEEDIIELAETLPFFAEHRVIRLDDTGLFKMKPERGDAFRSTAALLPDYLSHVPEQTVLVFNEEKVDKRSRMYKAVQKNGLVAEFQTLDGKALTNWVLKKLGNEGLRIRGNDMEYLLSRTGPDLNQISRETDKLIHYIHGSGDAGEVTRADIEAVITDQIENRIFDMIRCISEGKQKEALDLYADLLASKEAPIKILAVITREYNHLMLTEELMRDGANASEIASGLGIPPFAARRNLQIIRSYGPGALKEAFLLAVQSDEDIKSGRIRDRLAVELLIIRLSAR